MRYLRNILLLAGILLPASLFSQENPEDTLRVLDLQKAVIQSPAAIMIIVMQPLSLRQKDIESLNANDAGELVSKLPGTTVKSYGGLGGLKSVSIRGLGGEHTAVLVDGFRMTNTQTGQMNLGQLQAEGVVSASSSYVVPLQNMAPVSAVFAGNIIHMNTFLRGYGVQPKVSAVARYGSFGRKEAFVRGYHQKNGWYSGAFVKYRDAQGDYPFEFMNGSTLVERIRQNNDYADLNFGVAVRKRTDMGNSFHLKYSGSMINQGLPGAVLLYNETADERMRTADHRLSADFIQGRHKGAIRIYGMGGFNQLNYTDPTYLNAQGFLDEQYNNSTVTAGYLQTYRSNELYLKWGVEQTVDFLSGNRENLGQPLRSATYLLGSVEKRWRNYRFATDIGGQGFYDVNRSSSRTNIEFTPVARIERESSHHFNQHLWYKRTFRMPTFNELYFGGVGNENLNPERAHQVNLGINKLIRADYGGGTEWQVEADAFFNSVTDKILAIPAKNLFVWTIQNVGKAHVYGGTVATRFYRKWNNFRLFLMGNYTWQRVIDVTPDAVTYGHKIAYSPEHVGNLDVTFEWGEFSLRVSNNAVASRYALNENIPANYLPGFWTTDAALSYKHKFRNDHKLGVQLNVRNIADVQYAFIRSYAMPGRHFLIALNYEIP